VAFIGPFWRWAARARLPWFGTSSQASSGHRAERGGADLSEHGAAEPEKGAEAQDAVLLYVGGPLDGRVEIRPARHGEPLPTVTHVHLHEGPKVVHRYDLQPLTDQAGVYHVRPTPPRPARGEPAESDGTAGSA
jgi:hypothetical protein